jgi:heterodisulfide reductase subunit A
MSGRRIGVYVCHCGGNISDYVDVASVVAEVGQSEDVVVARRAMFTCSDATQQEIVQDIREQQLDGLVVASCSPKLHTLTFRDVARRAGLNPYQYTQVNIREQCSWAHTDDREGATRKATSLVRAGIARTGLTVPLEPMVVSTVPRALVIGGGVAGLRAAIALADLGLGVFVVERESSLGGRVAGLGAMFPHDRDGRELIDGLIEAVRSRDAVTVFTDAEVTSKAGSFGNYTIGVRVKGPEPADVQLEVGSVIVATGAEEYRPQDGEFGYGIDRVVTLSQLKQMLDRAGDGPLSWQGSEIRSIAYVYCVGSRHEDGEGGNPDCSRYCCTAAMHSSLGVSRLSGRVRQYHLYRDIRTYGRNEALYTRSRRAGSVFLKFPDDEPPAVAKNPATGRLDVTVHDTLSGGAAVTVPVDLVVLVTGMVARESDDLVRVLRLPLGEDGFFHEIHPKLRPVETVVDGVYIAGACQGPKTSAESVTSALAAVTQAAGILKRGNAELDPMVAVVRTDACTWCGTCRAACPYDAISAVEADGRMVATIDTAGCKGCGGCAPTCPTDAIDLLGYSDAQLTAMIDALARDAADVPGSGARVEETVP